MSARNMSLIIRGTQGSGKTRLAETLVDVLTARGFEVSVKDEEEDEILYKACGKGKIKKVIGLIEIRVVQRRK